MAAVGISALTAAVELVLVAQAGWFSLVPAMAATLFVLFRFSWPYLSRSLLIVALSTASYVLVDMRLHPEGWQSRRAAREKRIQARNAIDVARYQQVAEHMGFAPDAPPPQAVAAPPPPADGVEEFWGEARKELRVEGSLILQGGKRVAMINRQMREQDEVVSARYRDHIYRWRIRAITAKGVELEPLAAIP